MENLLTLTEFARAMASRPVGFAAIWIVEKGKLYDVTCKALAATARREGIRISCSQSMVIDPASLEALNAVKVIRKNTLDK